MTKSESFAKVVRVLTVPPILVIGMLTLLYIEKTNIFKETTEYQMSVIFLGVLPLLAYPLHKVIDKREKRGRETQRKIAFVCTIIGYLSALGYGILMQVSENLLLIFLTYVISIFILSVINQLTPIRASGHASGVLSPLVFLIYFGMWEKSIGFFIVCTLTFWASIKLKRHTPIELCMGCIVFLVSFVIAIVMKGWLFKL